MYDYYKGYIIREGNEGIDGAKLRELYEAVGWCGSSLPVWQNEKFEIAMINSAWAFTVWDKDDLIILEKYRKLGLGKKLVEKCIAKLPCGNWSARTTPENYEFYKKCGFSMQEETNATMEYNGFRMSRKDRG